MPGSAISICTRVLGVPVWNILPYAFEIPLPALLCRNRHTARSQVH